MPATGLIFTSIAALCTVTALVIGIGEATIHTVQLLQADVPLAGHSTDRKIAPAGLLRNPKWTTAKHHKGLLLQTMNAEPLHSARHAQKQFQAACIKRNGFSDAQHSCDWRPLSHIGAVSDNRTDHSDNANLRRLAKESPSSRRLPASQPLRM